jgi:N-acetylglutamate synthase-like GNAT family acetyltransferase
MYRKNAQQMSPKESRKEKSSSAFTIRPFRKTDIDFVIGGQLALYATEYGFTSQVWNDYLTGGVQEFLRQFDSARDCMYIAERDNTPCGCIAITHTEDRIAQLRFYFMERDCRGRGAGRRLMDRAIGFCRKANYKRVFLWTFSTLDAARHLYAGRGFRITDTHINNEWGEPILEEKWELEL